MSLIRRRPHSIRPAAMASENSSAAGRPTSRASSRASMVSTPAYGEPRKVAGRGPRIRHPRERAPSVTRPSALASREISRQPSRFAVSDTTQPETKHTQAQKEMRMLAAIEAVMEGKFPTNEQIDSFIDTVISSPAVDKARAKMGGDSRLLLDDVRDLMLVLKRVVNTKNADEAVQTLLWRTLHSASSYATSERMEEAGALTAGCKYSPVSDFSNFWNFHCITAPPTDSYMLVLSSIGTLLRLLLTSSEFRKMLGDINNFFQEVFRGVYETQDTASTTSKPERPVKSDTNAESPRLGKNRESYSSNPERGNVVYEAVYTAEPDRQDRGSVRHGPSPSYEDQFKYGRDVSTLGKEGRDELERTSGVTGQTTKKRASRYSKDDQEHRDSGYYGEEEKQQDSLAKQEGEVTPAPFKDIYERTTTMLSEKFTEERKRHLTTRLRLVLKELVKKRDFQSAIDTLYDTFVDLRRRSTDSGPRVDANVREAQREFQMLVERFASNKSLDGLLHEISDMNNNIQTDYILRDYVEELTTYIRRSLREPRYLDSVDWERKGGLLIERGRDILINRHLTDTQQLIGELNGFVKAFQEDEVTMELASKLNKIAVHLVKDENDRYTFKPQIIRDMLTVMLPLAFEQVKYIPIPRIEHEDANYYFVAEDIVLSSVNFLPNMMEIKLKNSILLGLHKEIGSETRHGITLNFYQIHALIQDVPFYYRKKSGFPKMSDYGVADLLVGGQGISIFIKIDFDQYSEYQTLVPRRVQCIVDTLRLEIHETHHDAFYKALGGTINARIKTQIERSIERNVYDLIDLLDSQISKIKSSYMKSPGLHLGTKGDYGGQFMRSFGYAKKVSPMLKKSKSSYPLLLGQESVERSRTSSGVGKPWYSETFSI